MDSQTHKSTSHQHLDDSTLEAEKCDCGTDSDQRRGPIEAASKTLRPQHVIAEEQRQVEDDANHRSSNAGQRRGELQFVVGGLHQRPAGEDEQERGQEGKPGDEAGCYSAGKECLFWPEDLIMVVAFVGFVGVYVYQVFGLE